MEKKYLMVWHKLGILEKQCKMCQVDFGARRGSWYRVSGGKGMLSCESGGGVWSQRETNLSTYEGEGRQRQVLCALEEALMLSGHVMGRTSWACWTRQEHADTVWGLWSGGSLSGGKRKRIYVWSFKEQQWGPAQRIEITGSTLRDLRNTI